MGHKAGFCLSNLIFRSSSGLVSLVADGEVAIIELNCEYIERR